MDRLFCSTRYKLGAPKGNFSEKINAEQLMMRYGGEVQRVFPIFYTLPHSYKINFCNRILLFLKQYGFHSRQNVVVSNGIKVKIAASYVKLTLGYRRFLINSLHRLLLYPTVQYFEEFSEYHFGHYYPKTKTIMMALDEFEKGILVPDDGKDLSLHEFAHALCFEMLNPKTLHPNADTFKKWYYKIVEWIEQPENRSKMLEDKWIRGYFFSNRIEAIAVLVELFFECGEQLRLKYSQLYQYIGKMLNYPSVLK